jgi:phosphopantothenoylcysteine decarboxylase/phosphopantothenate--cysteine ligase
MILNNKKILWGVSGSIAAYKIAFLTRLLVKEGAEVKIVMTQAAKEFITPLTLATLSKNPVVSEFVKDSTGTWNNHGFGLVQGRNADCACYSTYFIKMCQWYL